MQSNSLTQEEKRILLRLARESLEYAVKEGKLPEFDINSIPSQLREYGASFVTLMIGGDLRGCIGALDAYQSLAQDVREHAMAAALQDPRFPPVQSAELSGIRIEVSRLTEPVELQYSSGEELLTRLCPHVDGVILRDGYHRATFLPQVWEKLPDPAEFLENLCYKMGVEPNAWRYQHFTVQIYQVEEFHE